MSLARKLAVHGGIAASSFAWGFTKGIWDDHGGAPISGLAENSITYGGLLGSLILGAKAPAKQELDQEFRFRPTNSSFGDVAEFGFNSLGRGAKVLGHGALAFGLCLTGQTAGYWLGRTGSYFSRNYDIVHSTTP